MHFLHLFFLSLRW
uniref:Uncharacterized protein n=1 Tax=Anguilla anguilla TaxID=7936 RepID=A0A0E9RHQ9_ANGAN